MTPAMPEDLSALNAVISEIPVNSSTAVSAEVLARDEQRFFVVKDNIHVAGVANSAGTPSLRNFIPTENNGTVQLLMDAGAIPVAKTNMHELAFGITSNNAFFGAVGNYHDPLRFAGGSSGGTAVAVASGAVTWGLCTDTGGSCRIPAALNGVVGFRPSMGRYPSDHVTRLSSTRDTVGLITESAALLAELDALITGSEASEANPAGNYRIGVPAVFFSDLEAGIAESVEDYLFKLEAAGAELVSIDLGEFITRSNAISLPIVMFEAPEVLQQYLGSYYPQLSLEELIADIASEDVAEGFAAAIENPVSRESYAQAMLQRNELVNDIAAFIAGNDLDAIAYPTVPIRARSIASESITLELNGRELPTFPTGIRHTDFASTLGLPAITLPVPQAASELPVGVEFLANFGEDRRLLELAVFAENLQ
tara:strand:- start:364968 stop:366239 length:1272 start_codon:yes stop_codon:yes gene_type:complete